MQASHHCFTGSWRITIRPMAGTQSQVSLATMLADGTFIASPPVVEAFPPSPEGVLYVGTGHGEWRTTGRDQALLGFAAQASNSRGQMMGLGRVEAELVIEECGETFKGTYSFAMASPDGEIVATEEGVLEGRKIGWDHSAPRMADPTDALAAT